MKIAILSDLHGNSSALSCVLDEAQSLKVEYLLIAGDFVGYYYNIDKVLASLSDWRFDAIGGNHEKLLLDWINNKNRNLIYKKCGSSIKNIENYLVEKQIKWLTTLPEKKEFSIDGKTVLLCHGSPWNRNLYIYPDAKQSTIDKIFLEKKDIVIYGHTHYPAFYQQNNQIIVNPGSVGQTRDKIPGACWALWDTKNHSVTQKRTSYDTKELIHQCQINDPDLTYLQTVLTRTHEN